MRCELTPCTIQLSKIEIVIDKMHMAAHVDKWCHENCDPKLFAELNDVSLQDQQFAMSHCQLYYIHPITVY